MKVTRRKKDSPTEIPSNGEKAEWTQASNRVGKQREVDDIAWHSGKGFLLRTVINLRESSRNRTRYHGTLNRNLFSFPLPQPLTPGQCKDRDCG